MNMYNPVGKKNSSNGFMNHNFASILPEVSWT